MGGFGCWVDRPGRHWSGPPLVDRQAVGIVSVLRSGWAGIGGLVRFPAWVTRRRRGRGGWLGCDAGLRSSWGLHLGWYVVGLAFLRRLFCPAVGDRGECGRCRTGSGTAGEVRVKCGRGSRWKAPRFWALSGGRPEPPCQGDRPQASEG